MSKKRKLFYYLYKSQLAEARATGRTDIFNLDIADGGTASDAGRASFQDLRKNANDS